MRELPEAATTIDPSLREVGAEHAYQRLVFGQVQPPTRALVVAQLIAEHPSGAGAVGRFYGTRLKGIMLGDRFRPWGSEGLGEVTWDPAAGAWVAADGSGPVAG